MFMLTLFNAQKGIAMGIKRLNHAVLYVSDVRQSADFIIRYWASS